LISDFVFELESENENDHEIDFDNNLDNEFEVDTGLDNELELSVDRASSGRPRTTSGLG
jgi:hypothetical protein